MRPFRHEACGGQAMTQFRILFVKYQRPLRLVWLAAMLVLAACNNGDNGGGGGDGGNPY
jgi:hypothetical protein